MASVSFGGDPEGYMDPPRMTQTDKAGPLSFIASLLDLLGIGDPVARAPADEEVFEPEITPQAPVTTATPGTPAAPSNLSVLQDAESAFPTTQPIPTDWGRRYLNSIKPIQVLDPNTLF
jgi:hypothetical protein